MNAEHRFAICALARWDTPQYNYKPNLHHQDEYVVAPEEGSGGAEDSFRPTSSGPEEGPAKHSDQPRKTDSEPMMRVTPDELAKLAPKLRAYLRTPSPTWPEIVDAADWLRHDLGVSKPLWGDACLAMGREHAAIALAIVSTNPPPPGTSPPAPAGISTAW